MDSRNVIRPFRGPALGLPARVSVVGPKQGDHREITDDDGVEDRIDPLVLSVYLADWTLNLTQAVLNSMVTCFINKASRKILKEPSPFHDSHIDSYLVTHVEISERANDGLMGRKSFAPPK